MSESDSEKVSVGCFAMFKRHSLRRRTSKRNSTNDKETRPTTSVVSSSHNLNCSTESLASIFSLDESFSSIGSGTLDSFAKMITSESGRQRRRHSGTYRLEKLIMYPFFGHFAGQKLYFDLKRNTEHSGSVAITIKVRTDDQVIAVLHHRLNKRSKETVRDECIKFVHEATTQLVSNQPPSLSFQCEKHINLHLNEIPYTLLPPRYKNLFTGCDRTVRIHIHPHEVHNQPITMRLKPRLSMRELQWMISERLSLSNPSSIALYLKDSLNPLSATASLNDYPTSADIVCIIPPTAQHQRLPANQGPVSVCVSIIGKGVDEVSVYGHTTLFEFERIVKQKFNLKPDCFLYLPEVLSNNNQSCPLRMHTIIDSSMSTALLLHQKKRSFPILYGHLTVSEQQTLQSLLLYRMSISELDLLKSGPIIGFEVTGPTIPVRLRTIQDSNDMSGFMVMSVQPHAVSVNPEWSVSVLIKFLSCLSCFPCSYVTIGDRELCPSSSVKDEILNQELFHVEGNKYFLSKDVPTCLA